LTEVEQLLRYSSYEEDAMQILYINIIF